MLLTIWSSSSGMQAIMSTLNRAYDIEESRPWWKVRLTAILMTIGAGVFVVVSFALIVVGPTTAEHVAQWFGLGPAFVWAWWILQWPAVFVLVAVGLALIYYYGPDAEQDWVWITPGSLVATVLWVLFSLGFKLYVMKFTNYNETYGAIGGAIVLMLWFYASGLAMLIGAEVNAEIEHASPYGKAPGEKVPGERRKIGAAAARAWEAAERRLHRRPRSGAAAGPSPQPAPAPAPASPPARPAAAAGTGEMVAGGVLAGLFGLIRKRKVKS
jgi:membrane protein